jgi:hypothetical protein
MSYWMTEIGSEPVCLRLARTGYIPAKLLAAQTGSVLPAAAVSRRSVAT